MNLELRFASEPPFFFFLTEVYFYRVLMEFQRRGETERHRKRQVTIQAVPKNREPPLIKRSTEKNIPVSPFFGGGCPGALKGSEIPAGRTFAGQRLPEFKISSAQWIRSMDSSNEFNQWIQSMDSINGFTH